MDLQARILQHTIQDLIGVVLPRLVLDIAARLERLAEPRPRSEAARDQVAPQHDVLRSSLCDMKFLHLLQELIAVVKITRERVRCGPA